MNLREKGNGGIENSLRRIVEFSKSTTKLKFFSLTKAAKGDFICAVCGSSFVTKFLLNLHRTTQCAMLPHACTKCDLRFATRANLLHHRRIHWKSNHLKNNKIDSDLIESTSVVAYKCDVCDLTFRKPSKLLRHRRLHSGEKSFQCNRCNLGFNWKSNLTRHLKTQCFEKDLDDKDFDQTYGQNSNVSRQKIDPKRERLCTIQVSKNRVKVQHVKMEAIRGEIYKIEKLAGVGSDNGQKSIKVEEIAPTENESEESVGILQKNLDKNTSLRVACKQETGVFSRRYECEYCYMGFKYKSDLLRHLGTHDSVKPFQCDYCDLGFNWKSNLVRHQRRFHFGVKAYMCNKCDISFVKKYHLLRHKKTHIEDDANCTPKSDLHLSRKNSNEDFSSESNDLDRRLEASHAESNELDAKVEKLSGGLHIKHKSKFEQLQKSPIQVKKRGKYKSRINKNRNQFGEISVEEDQYKSEKSIKDEYADSVQNLDSITEIMNIIEEPKGMSINECNLDKSFAVNVVAIQSTSNPRKSGLKNDNTLEQESNFDKLQGSPKRKRQRGKYENRVKPDECTIQEQCEEIISNYDLKSGNLTNQSSAIAQDLELIAQEVNTNQCNEESKDISLQSDGGKNCRSLKSSHSKRKKNSNIDARNEVKRFPCSYCDRVFTQKSSHFQHERSHDRKPVSCGVCLRSFNRKSVLKRHTLIHTGEKPFKCDDCCKYFRQKSQLVQHMKTHNRAKLYECETCKRRFDRKSILKRHRMIHSQKPLQCEMCLLSFSEKTLFDQHQKDHCDLKQFKSQLINSEGIENFEIECEQCNLCFPRRKVLQHHEKLHAGFTSTYHTYNTRFSLKQEIILEDSQNETNPDNLCDELVEDNRGLQEENFNQEQSNHEAEEYNEQTDSSHNSRKQIHRNTENQEMTASKDSMCHSDLQEHDDYIENTNDQTDTSLQVPTVQEPKYREADPLECNQEIKVSDENYETPEKINIVQVPESNKIQPAVVNEVNVLEHPADIPTIQKRTESNFSRTETINDPDVTQLTIIHIQSKGNDKQADGSREQGNERREDCDEIRSEEIQSSQINTSREDDKHEISPTNQALGQLDETSNSTASEPPEGKTEKVTTNQDSKCSGICSDRECQVDIMKDEVSKQNNLTTEIESTVGKTIGEKIDYFPSKPSDGNKVKDFYEEEYIKLRKISISMEAMRKIKDREYCIDLHSNSKTTDVKLKSYIKSPIVDKDLNPDLETKLEDNLVDKKRNSVEGNFPIIVCNDHNLEAEHLINSILEEVVKIQEQKEKNCQNLELVKFEKIHCHQQPARYVEIGSDQDPIPCKVTVSDHIIMQLEEFPIEQDPDRCSKMNICEDFIQVKTPITLVSNEDKFIVQRHECQNSDHKNSHSSGTMIRNDFSERNIDDDIPNVSAIQVGKINAELRVDIEVDTNLTLKKYDQENLKVNENSNYRETSNVPDSSSLVELSSGQEKNPKLEINLEKDLIQCEDISTTQNSSQNEDLNDQVAVCCEEIPIRKNLTQQETGPAFGHIDILSEKYQLEVHAATKFPDLNDQLANPLNTLNAGTSSFVQSCEMSGFGSTLNGSSRNALAPFCEKSKIGPAPKRSLKARSAKKRVKRQDSEIDKVLDLFKHISIEDIGYHENDKNHCFEMHIPQHSEADQLNPYTLAHSENENAYNDPSLARFKDIYNLQNPVFDEPFISDQQAIQLVNDYVGYEKISIRQNITVEHFVECEEINLDQGNEQIRFVNTGSIQSSALPSKCNPVRFDPIPVRPIERNLVQCDETYIRKQEIRKLQDSFHCNQTCFPMQFQDNMRVAQSLVRNEEISRFSVQYEKFSTDTVKHFDFSTHKDWNRIPKIGELSKASFQESHQVSGSNSGCNRNKQIRSSYEKLQREVVRKQQECALLSSTNQFGCERCDQCFKRKEDLIRHRFTEHEKNLF